MGPVEIEGYGHGGLGVARLDGKVHFVEGAIPGDVVTIEVTRDRPRWARATVAEVVAPGPDRRVPPCPHAGTCGGCDLQHATESAQRRWKRGVVAEQLARLGGVADPPVAETVVPGPDLGYRNRMDFAVLGGRPALRRRSSHDLVPLEVCLLLAPPLADLFDRLGDLEHASGLTLRAGLATGERLAVVDGPVPASAADWGVPICRATDRGVEPWLGRDHLHEEVAGHRLRITGKAFFQTNTAGAEALVAAVADAVTGRSGTLLDLYAGGGLFAATVGPGFDRVVAVEVDRVAVADLHHNLADSGAEVHAGRVEDVPLSGSGRVTAVVDPPRRGLGRDGVASVLSASPDRIVHVACDPASLGRDVGLLAEAGYRLASVTPIDLFPQTHHVEAVAVLDR